MKHVLSYPVMHAYIEQQMTAFLFILPYRALTRKVNHLGQLKSCHLLKMYAAHLGMLFCRDHCCHIDDMHNLCLRASTKPQCCAVRPANLVSLHNMSLLKSNCEPLSGACFTTALLHCWSSPPCLGHLWQRVEGMLSAPAKSDTLQTAQGSCLRAAWYSAGHVDFDKKRYLHHCPVYYSVRTYTLHFYWPVLNLLEPACKRSIDYLG